MPNSKYYIDNNRFEELIHEFSSGNRENENELMKMFDLLITNIMNGFKFAVDEDDAKQETFLLILKILKNFSSDKGSAFNYFTTAIMNNLRLIYTKNRKYAEKIARYQEYKTGYNPSCL